MEENENSSKYVFFLGRIHGKQKMWSRIKFESGEIKMGINTILNEKCKFYNSQNIEGPEKI